MLSKGVDWTARWAERTGFIRLLEKLSGRGRGVLRVLTYHRVDDPSVDPDLYPNLIGATPSEFDWQARYLSENYRVVSMSDVQGALLRGRPLPDKAVLITFDDAYRDFAAHAWPTLRRLGMPVTLFVPTAFPDQPQKSFWWDRLYAALRRTDGDELLLRMNKILQAATANSTPGPSSSVAVHPSGGVASSARPSTWGRGGVTQPAAGVRRLVFARIKSLPDEQAQHLVDQICHELGAPAGKNMVLGWDALRRLAAEGVTLAPHTRQHPLLNRVSLARAREEISGSLADLRQQVGEVPPVFAYPSGAYNRHVVSALPSMGVQLAFTTCRGLNDLGRTDPLRVRRINVGWKTSSALLRAQLFSWTRHLNWWMPVPEGQAEREQLETRFA